MINIERFAFNSFQVNTYVLWDDTKECAIVDPGCYDESEEEELFGFILKEGLKPVRLLNTHCHIDHIVGVASVSRKYNLKPEAHPDCLPFIRHAEKIGYVYGFDRLETMDPQLPLKAGDIIRFGKSELEIIETPGHANGSLCFISHEGKFIITGDVIFYQSIGRTDLPTGNYDVLIRNIREKILTLPRDYRIFAGHGPETTVGFEAYSNPFLTNV